MSLNQYIATVLASRVGAQAEAERGFAARDILARAGKNNPPRPDDEFEEGSRL